MMRSLFAFILSLTFASPALAAPKPFFSLANNDFIVLISFVLFFGILVYFKVPGLLGGLLDKRADNIRSELEEARALREEAQTILASYERKQKEVQEQANRIVATAREDAQLAARQARDELEQSITRRLTAAEDQIAAAQATAIKEVRDQAITIAVAAAKQLLAKQMTAAKGNKLINAAIAEVDAKLH